MSTASFPPWPQWEAGSPPGRHAIPAHSASLLFALPAVASEEAVHCKADPVLQLTARDNPTIDLE